MSTTPAPESGATTPTPPERSATTALGIILIALGGAFLVATSAGSTWAPMVWPLFVIAPGVALFAMAILGGKSWTWFAVPASIVTTVGAILWVQNTFDLWQTWAYAWALIFPTSVGFGLWVKGVLNEDSDVQRQGRGMLLLGVAMFAGFAVFFEGLLNLSGISSNMGGRYVLPGLLIAVGAWLVMVRQPLTHK